MALIEVTGLTYTYPTGRQPALSDVSFAVEAGELVAILGANNAGKSTLCYALSGYVPHFFQGKMQGRVVVAGQETAVTPLPHLVSQIGLVFQNPANQMTGARFTVAEEVAFGLENLGVPPVEIGARVAEALALAGVADLAERAPLALSGGQQQRVALAAMLAMKLPILALDEPTSQLDPPGSTAVFTVLRHLSRQGTTLLLATHKLEWAATFADRVLLLHDGALVADGPPQAVLTHPDLTALGLRPLRYTEVARLAQTQQLWPVALPLPVTLETAVAGFKERELELEPEKVQPLNSSIRNPKPVSRYPMMLSIGNATRIPTYGLPLTNTGFQIQIENLHYQYPNGVTALRDVSLEIAAGERVALIGHNGSGKTTLVKHLNGLLRPVAGRVLLGDWAAEQHTIAQLARRVAYLFQNPDEQLCQRTVWAEVAFGPRNFGCGAEEVKRRVTAALGSLGLTGQAQTNPYDLNLPERKRVALAAVAAMETPVVVLDEPTTGQDAAFAEQMAALLNDWTAAGKTVLAISHDMEFVADHFPRTVLLHEGRVVADGPTLEVLNAPETTSIVQPPQLMRLARELDLVLGGGTAVDFLDAYRTRKP